MNCPKCKQSIKQWEVKLFLQVGICSCCVERANEEKEAIFIGVTIKT